MSSIGCADTNPVFEIMRLASLDGIVARAGGGQSQNPLPAGCSMFRVTTVASANDSVTLPASQGLILVVANAGANSMNVFPFKGDQINALGINAAFAMAAGKVAIFVSTGPGQYHTVLTA